MHRLRHGVGDDRVKSTVATLHVLISLLVKVGPRRRGLKKRAHRQLPRRFVDYACSGVGTGPSRHTQTLSAGETRLEQVFLLFCLFVVAQNSFAALRGVPNPYLAYLAVHSRALDVARGKFVFHKSAIWLSSGSSGLGALSKA